MTNNKQQTAIEQMLAWVRTTFPMDLDTPRMIEDKLESLLEVEKEQIIDAGNKCQIYNDGFIYEDGEQYYNQTYQMS